MIELTEQNAAEILHAHGHLRNADAMVRELSGGVSNAVFLIGHGNDRFVVKQARGKLRVAADWQCSVERIWREVEVLGIYVAILNPITYSPWRNVPQILWTDRELYAYAMSAASPEARPWKELLLAGKSPEMTAPRAGQLLGKVHAHTWHEANVAEEFKDRTFFAQLRLEPYYLAAAEKYPKLVNPLGDLVDMTWREQHALVHGDFSPKNILVDGESLLLIDFEVGHYGDPAFDVGFFLTHLVLKAIHVRKHRIFMLQAIQDFWTSYFQSLQAHDGVPSERQPLEGRCIQHLAGCLVARVHGKSPVDYLTLAEQLRAVKLAEDLFDLGLQANFSDAFELVRYATAPA